MIKTEEKAISVQVISEQVLTLQQHLLVKLSEEASEVAQAVSKALLFGLEHSGPNMPTNIENINAELADLWGTMEVCRENGIALSIQESAVTAKKSKIFKYFRYSREIGMLSEKDE
jgi:NTP pyrophosphatase (non-canonical NTP hydrolase)